MKKLSKRIACAFCALATDDAAVGEYVELEITVPESAGTQRQLFGAHVACLDVALADGRQVEVDLLIDEAELGGHPT